jgi:hypothetical protein
MSLIQDDATGVSFGSVVRGGYSPVLAIKTEATTETLTQVALFLEDDGGLSGADFRAFKSATAIPGIEAGDAALSDELVEQNGVSDFSNISLISGDGLVLDPEGPEYVWLDVKPGVSDTVGSSNLNYRLIFEYE